MSSRDTLSLLSTIVTLGYEIRVRTIKTVRDQKDVKVVSVEIGSEFTGEGVTPSEALEAAFLSLRGKVQSRLDRDKAILSVFDEPEIETDLSR